MLMRKILLILTIASFLTIGMSGPSWAMGRVKHHGGGGSSSFFHGNQGTFSGNHWDNDGNKDNDHNNGNNNAGDDNKDSSNHLPDGHFPAAPVPEPLSLYLMATGLGLLFLGRKKLVEFSR